jgi:putative ABC transport system substrate-binding protein
MRRREFITLVGAAAALPLAARAQAMPVIGILGGATVTAWAPFVHAFRQGLSEAGFVEGRNVAIGARWAEGQYDRLPAMVADLIQRQVTMIAAFTTPAALAAKAAAQSIPVVFTTISDPVQIGLVASLRQPGGNVTGVTTLYVEVGPKLLEILHEAVPTATSIAVLVNPTNPNTATALKALEAAARTMGLKLHVLQASTAREIDTAFAALVELRAGGLMIGGDTFLNTRSEQLGALAHRYALPTIFSSRTFPPAGGLMSYGGNPTDAYHQAGLYAARVLRGEKPADLPVVRSTKVELIVNLKAAKALGLTLPTPLLGRADEVIE